MTFQLVPEEKGGEGNQRTDYPGLHVSRKKKKKRRGEGLSPEDTVKKGEGGAGKRRLI